MFLEKLSMLYFTLALSSFEAPSFDASAPRRHAPMTIHDRIEINPKIMVGKPVIRGTRIPVELIVRKMAEGADEKAVLQAYPTLTSKDVYAALRYAADALAHEEVVLSVAG